jgi:DNA polymerase-3 subunit epsilon
MSDVTHLAAELDQHPDYRVLRRLAPVIIEAEQDPAWRKAVILDTETTSLDTATCKVIEIGLKPVWYDEAGIVRRALPAQSWLQDPGEPLTPEIIEVTGLTDADLAGQAIPDHDVAAAVEGALVIAHNAGFDRPVCERRFPWAERHPWACSATEVAWRKHGSQSASLPAIATHLGVFYDAHRAADDCEALAAMLIGGFLGELLTSARSPSARVWASAAPFESKDVLKARGYRWHDGKVGRSKCWYRDMAVEEADHEIAWLKNNDITGIATAQSITAKTRFSSRSFQS